MRTEFEFVLPRGYIDGSGSVHKRGIMRLATARDELQPLRDPTITGADDPRLTLLVLVRVVESLGDLPMVTVHEIEGLFAADLAYLQDFYGVINFGTDADIDALLAAQRQSEKPVASGSAGGFSPGDPSRGEASQGDASQGNGAPTDGPPAVARPDDGRPLGRRAAIHEVPSSPR
jgi:hypothetical protein